MLSLGHIEPTLEQVSKCVFFCTITLPKACYRKSAKSQAVIMDRLFKRIGVNYFKEAYGVYELTQKGNIHCHCALNLRDDYMQLSTSQASARMMSAFLKSYSNCDFQVIKNHSNIYEYLVKDIQTTTVVLETSPFRSLVPKPDAYKNPISEQVYEVNHGIDYNEEFYD